MKQRTLGRTGLFVSELCLGTMTFGGDGGMWGKIGNLQQADAERLVGRALDAGINFIDTADVYSGGVSEQITGQALKNLKVPRENVVVATKVFGETGTGPQRARRLARSHPGRRQGEPEAAAARPHRPLPDPRLRPGHADRGNGARARPAGAARPRALRRRVELGGLADRQGARHLRAPGPGALRVAAGLLHASPGATSSASSCRCCTSEGVGLMVWSPLAGGLLSGKYGRDAATPRQGSRRTAFDFPPVDQERAYDCIDAMRADRRGARASRWRRSRWPGCCTSRR